MAAPSPRRAGSASATSLRPGGLRLDAVARYLQDVADDDTRDAAFEDASGWVVRRTVIDVHRFPRFLEPLSLTTWCSATGARWAERRVSITGEGGGEVEAATLWVHLDPRTMRPQPLPASFFDVFGPSTMGRRVRATLHLPDPAPSASSVPWPLRASDLDVMRHVNNAVSWVAVEERLAARPDLRAPLARRARAPRRHRRRCGGGSDLGRRAAGAPRVARRCLGRRADRRARSSRSAPDDRSGWPAAAVYGVARGGRACARGERR